MQDKVIDILPPEESNQEKRLEKHIEIKKKKGHRFFVVILVLLALSFSVVFFSTAYSSLNIKLQIAQREVSIQDEIEADVSQLSVDFDKKIIPARIFKSEKKAVKTFKSTGEKEEQGRAEGFIRIYNNSRSGSVALRANTRFLSSKGAKIFTIQDKVVIPPARVENGKTVAGFVDAKVVAQNPGPDYNIGPSKFSVPGLVGTNYYYTIWAESKSDMKGGFANKISIVSQNDLDNAKNKLQEELREEAISQIKNALASKFIVPKEAFSVDNFQFSCNKDVGEPAAEFECSGDLLMKGIGFKLSDIKDLASYLIKSNYKSLSEKLREETVALDYYPKTILLKQGKVILSLSAKGDLYKAIEKEILLSQIIGKESSQIERAILKSCPQAEGVKLEFRPFWVKKAPKNPERIKIQPEFAD